MDLYKLENTKTGRVVYVNFKNEIINYLRRWGCKNMEDVIYWALHVAWTNESRQFNHIRITIIK